VRDGIKSIQFSRLKGIQVDKKYSPLKSLQTVFCAWHLVKLVYQERVTVKTGGPQLEPLYHSLAGKIISQSVLIGQPDDETGSGRGFQTAVTLALPEIKDQA
jgi:hypothetical protein